MTLLLVTLLVLAAGATLFVLIKGVINMAQQKDLTGQRSQELMRKRVLFQAIDDVLDGDGYAVELGADGARRLAEDAATRAHGRLGRIEADTTVLGELVERLAVRTV